MPNQNYENSPKFLTGRSDNCRRAARRVDIVAIRPTIGRYLLVMLLPFAQVLWAQGPTAPTVAISSPGENANFNAFDAITIDVTAMDANGTVVSVEFFIDGNLFATDDISPYSFIWNTTDTDLGHHVLTAQAVDNHGNATVSDPVNVLIAEQFYFVNDNSLTNDLWCTATGSDANDGLTPATPMATVQSVILTYGIIAGDIILIDTGNYTLNSNIVVDATVNIQVSPYGVTIDRADPSAGSYVWELQANEVVLETAMSTKFPVLPQSWMKLTGGNSGIHITGLHCVVRRCDLNKNHEHGVSIAGSSANFNTVENTILRDTDSADGRGITVTDSVRTTIRNCTIVGNGKYGVYLDNANNVNLINSIIYADGNNNYGVFLTNGSTQLFSDFNNLIADNGAFIGHSGGDLATLADWRAALPGKDANSLSIDPLFVNVAGGEFHLRSVSGHYDNGGFTADSEHSPSIDAGDPAASTGMEPPPHGNVVNQGAYGGTEQASKSSFDLINPDPSATVTPVIDFVSDAGENEIFDWNRIQSDQGDVDYIIRFWLDASRTQLAFMSAAQEHTHYILTPDKVESRDYWWDVESVDQLGNRVTSKQLGKITVEKSDLQEIQGQVTLFVSDRLTGAKINNFSVAFSPESPIVPPIEDASENVLSAWLTNGSYTLTVTAPGYNPIQLNGVSVDSNLQVLSASMCSNTATMITSCAGSRILTPDDNCQAMLPNLTAEVIATDHCDPSMVFTTTQNPAPGLTLALGDTVPVILTVTDESANTESCIATVTVADRTPPVISGCFACRALTLDGTAMAMIPDLRSGLTISDNCDTNVRFTQNLTPGTIVGPGSQDVVFTATDDDGNTATCTVTLTTDFWSHTFQLDKGWNLISFPGPLCPTGFLDDRTGPIWSWNGAAGTLEHDDQLSALEGKNGYFVYFEQNQPPLSVRGCPPDTASTTLGPGWNFIGVANPVTAANTITGIISPIWFVNRNTLVAADNQLIPFVGYWLYSTSNSSVP